MKFSCWFSGLLLCLNFPLPAEEKNIIPASSKLLPAEDLYSQVCAVCHGKSGEGSQVLKAPSIAGLPDWYTLLQIKKFRADQRGTNADDRPGLIMHNLAQALDNNQFQGVAKLVALMPMHPTRNTMGGDEKRGKEVFTEVCAKCHRFNGKGEKTFGSAPLIGLQDWYIRAQLHKFREGIRGGSASDEKGFKMHEMARYLSNENASDVTAHIATLAKKYANTKSRRDREFDALNKEKKQKTINKNALPEELR